MSALSATGFPVLIEHCSNLPTSNKDLYSFILFPILPFLVGLHMYQVNYHLYILKDQEQAL